MSFRVAVLVTIGFTLAVPWSADAWTRRTPSLAQHPDGYLHCSVTGTSKRPIAIVAAIVNARRANVTEFGYGSRELTEDGFQAEETAGSFDGASERYKCKATVTGARHKDVFVSLTAFDRDGQPIATVGPRD